MNEEGIKRLVTALGSEQVAASAILKVSVELAKRAGLQLEDYMIGVETIWTGDNTKADAHIEKLMAELRAIEGGQS